MSTVTLGRATSIAARLVLTALLAGCLDGGPVECGNLLCPTGKVCVPAAALCATPAAVNACVGLEEGAACAVAGEAAGTCRNTVCVAAYCGNRLTEPGEACDDGNTTGGDGCSADCRSTEVCGNGVVDVTLGEGCDCGDANAPTRPPGCTGPNSDSDATQTCSTTCTPHGCGDGVVAGLEQCDGMLLDGKTCTDVGFYGGTLGCSSVCRFDTSACVGRCGDGIVNGAEDCDGSGGSDTCLAENFDAGLVGCNQTLCRTDTQGCRLIGWRPLRAPLIGTIGAIWGTSRSDVWASASNQTALGTYFTTVEHFDGTNWTQNIIGGKTVAMRGTGPRDVWAVGDTVYHWDGTSWTERRTGSISAHTAVWPFAADNVWIADGTSTLYRWNGTAYTSMPVNAPATTAVTWLWAFSPTDVYAGNSTRILHYDGISWSTSKVIPAGTINQAWGVASNDMFFVGTTTVRFVDGVWNVGTVGTQRLGIWGTSARNVYAVGDGGIERWDGVKWLNVAPNGLSIWGADDRFVLAGSADGLARSDGSDWHDFGSPGGNGSFQYKTLAVSAGDLYAANIDISRFSGGVWQTATMSYASTLVARDDQGDVFAMDSTGYLSWTGTAWVSVTPQPPALGTPAASWADPVSFETWTVGSAGQVMRRAAGGAFTSFDQSAWGQLNAVDGITGGPIYVVGKTVALRWNGSTWSDISSPLTTELTGVYAANASSVYAVGNGGKVLHFDGRAWTAMSTAITANLNAIDGLADDDVFAAGTDGALWHWDGTVWSAVRTDTGVALNAMRVTPYGIYVLLTDGTVRLLFRPANGP